MMPPSPKGVFLKAFYLSKDSSINFIFCSVILIINIAPLRGAEKFFFSTPGCTRRYKQVVPTGQLNFPISQFQNFPITLHPHGVFGFVESVPFSFGPIPIFTSVTFCPTECGSPLKVLLVAGPGNWLRSTSGLFTSLNS